jgi:hypothetical protein
MTPPLYNPKVVQYNGLTNEQAWRWIDRNAYVGKLVDESNWDKWH